jgi:hypothetical protein
MGEAKRRKLAREAGIVRPRTVADIIAGRRPGVFGLISPRAAFSKGTKFNGWFPTIIATLFNPVGLPLCDCGKEGRAHATAILAGMPCDGAPSYDEWEALIARRVPVEIVGDIVVAWDEEVPLVSCFFFAGCARRSMTVPDRATIPISEHCKVCPMEIWPPR